MVEVVPNPLLISYFQEACKLDYELDRRDDRFVLSGEWHYIPSNLDDNIFLLKNLYDKGLLSDSINVCDCGIGLGTTMFDLYLQSKDISEKKFTFTGIEKYEKYTNYLKQNLFQFWNGKLNLIEGDILQENYYNYNFIYSYSPFNKIDKLMSFYQRIISQAPAGTIFIGLDTWRIRNYGKGFGELISDFEKLLPHKIDNLHIFQKP